ncbi:MAG: hypothetical protein EOL93_00705 [Epsilonproteobacteria bacterium]|nr:hypothetical protein [Campylobacterota bacterium]
MAQYEAVITTGVAPDTTVAKTALWQYGKKYYFGDVDGNVGHVGCNRDNPLKFNVARAFLFVKNRYSHGYRMEW